MQCAEQELLRLTDEQMRILDLLRDTKRLVVRGGAGSGKTLLALEKATRLVRDGKYVLLLCCSIPLAQWLQTR
jgi:superfamily II DNA or RNA helicase